MAVKFTFIDLFGGIGGIRIAFERVGGKCVFSSEWDKAAQKQYAEYFGEEPKGDITKIHSKNIPKHDILLAGFPCQPFSIMGNGSGFMDTRGTMFFEIERILREKKPKAFLLENVKQLKSHDKGRTFETILSKLDLLGYTLYSDVLNALDFGLPQKRERVIIVGFKKKTPFVFPLQKKKRIPLEEILEPDDKVGSKYFASERIRKKRQKAVENKKVLTPSIWHENKAGNISIHPYACALRAGASYNYLLVNGKRRLTPRECLRLQGFPEDFPIVVSDMQLRKQVGNAVPVPMIEAVAKEMLNAMNKNTKTVFDKYE